MAYYEKGARNFFGSVNDGINDRLKDISTLGPVFGGEENKPRNFDSDGHPIPDSDVLEINDPPVRQRRVRPGMVSNGQVSMTEDQARSVMAHAILGIADNISDQYTTYSNFQIGHKPQIPLTHKKKMDLSAPIVDTQPNVVEPNYYDNFNPVREQITRNTPNTMDATYPVLNETNTGTALWLPATIIGAIYLIANR